PDDFVDLFPTAALQKQIDRRAKQCVIAQERRDVFENDPLFRKIRNIADACAQSIDYCWIHPWDASGTTWLRISQINPRELCRGRVYRRLVNPECDEREANGLDDGG